MTRNPDFGTYRSWFWALVMHSEAVAFKIVVSRSSGACLYYRLMLICLIRAFIFEQRLSPCSERLEPLDSSTCQECFRAS